MTAEQFNPVEAQQHITEARKVSERFGWDTNGAKAQMLIELLSSDLESAVEYIAGLEKQNRELLVAGEPHRRSNRKWAALEAEVARLNSERDERAATYFESGWNAAITEVKIHMLPHTRPLEEFLAEQQGEVVYLRDALARASTNLEGK